MSNAVIKDKKNSGFSLVELIVVIAIMAVMIGGGVITMRMLIGAEAKQGAKKMEAQLNDIKTGAMSRAGEYMIVRYIEVSDSNKDALAKAGIDKSGFYAEKRATTITNADTIVVDYSSDAEYSRIGSKKMAMKVNDSFIIGGASGLTKAIRIEYNRANGSLKSVQTGTVSGTGLSDTFSGDSDIKLDNIVFQSAAGTGRAYKIEFDAVTGKHTME